MNSNCASSSCEMDLSLSCCETQDLSWLKAFSFFFLAKQPDHDRDQYRLFGILLLEWSGCAICSMEITFPNPSTARHDRNPKLGINYGLSRANMINP